MTTPADLGAAGLPLTVDARTAAEWLGVAYETYLDAVKTGDAPVMPIRVGRIFRVSTALLLEALGLDEPGPGNDGDGPRRPVHRTSFLRPPPLTVDMSLPDRPPVPADMGAEDHVIGGILIHPGELLAPVLAAVRPGDFYQPYAARVLEAAAAVGVPADPFGMAKAVHHELLTRGVHTCDRDAMRLIELVIRCPPTWAAVAAAERVRELARARRALLLADDACRRLAAGCAVDDVAPLLVGAASA